MNPALATWLVDIFQIYVLAGFLFALAFVLRGIARLDPAAAAGTRGFRLVVFPGVIAFWPLLAWRWLRFAEGTPSERNAHRDAARERTNRGGAVGGAS